MAKDILPTEQDLAALPLWARVAFAARCARRVLPLFRAAWPEAPAEHVEALENAVKWAERGAAIGPGTRAPAATRSGIPRLAEKARRAAPIRSAPAAAVALSAAGAISEAQFVEHGRSPKAAAASSAYKAARLAAEVMKLAAGEALLGTHDKGAFISHSADEASQFIDFGVKGIIRDFELLREAASTDGWTDATPVAPEFFGPLWPTRGEADSLDVEWEKNPYIVLVNACSTSDERLSGDEEVVLKIAVPDDATDEEVLAFARELVSRADDIHRECGGHGLKVKHVEVEQEAAVPAEVCP